LLPVTNAQVQFKRGALWDFLCDHGSRYVDLEGAIRSGKTTVCLWKVIYSCAQHAGIQWLVCRYSDAETRTKLKPRIAELCIDAGIPIVWNATEMAYEFPNGSRVFVFGLKTQDQSTRYAKLRGLTLAGIYVDQAEELPFDVYEELKGRLSQRGMPQQLIVSPNPPSEDHWLAKEFPEDNRFRGTAYYRTSLYDNAENLDPETIASLEAAYPPGHAKHGPMLLGQRGVNVMGQPVYGPLDPREPGTAAFQRTRHVRDLLLLPDLPLLEAIDFGRHHPCVVWAQFTSYGDLLALGGVMGQNIYLHDFVKVIQTYRQTWFPAHGLIQTCCDPAGSHENSQGVAENGVSILRDHGIHAMWRADSNTPTVRLGMVERIASHMRSRSPLGESFGIDKTRWLRISATAVIPHAFLADGCQAGYVWDEHLISVANKPVRRPKKDGWYEHGQNCLEYLEHNFGGVQPTLEQSIRRAHRVPREVRDVDPADQWRRGGRPTFSRGGYA